MASTPSGQESKREHVGETVQQGVTGFKTFLRPFSDSESSSAPLPTTGPAPPGRSAISGPSTPAQPASLRNDTSTGRGGFTGSSTVGCSIAPTTIAASTKPSDNNEREEAKLSGLESDFHPLGICADRVSALKPVIGELISCLDVIPASTTSIKEYDELTSELKIMAYTLVESLGELSPEEVGDNASCARIALSIEVEVVHVQNWGDRSGTRRVFESVEDTRDMLQRYRRIEGLFRQLLCNICAQTLKNTDKRHMTKLLRGMSPVDGALYNSRYSAAIQRHGCMAGTREKVQADLQDWVQDPNGAKVYWMSGVAGIGKTTIACSLCEWLKANHRLGASFFCSRVSSSCRNANMIVPTIAYQLASYSPAFRSALCKVLENASDDNKLGIVAQFEKLLRAPMAAAMNGMPEGVVVVIDALDECEGVDGVRIILQVLLRLGRDLPLRFFVTSRPESTIRYNMLSSRAYLPGLLHMHDIEQSVVGGDVKKYLFEALSSMSQALATEHIEQIAELSGGLFIYASTVVRYILLARGGIDSVAWLNELFMAGLKTTNENGPGKRYRLLDELYSTVLATALGGALERGWAIAMRLVLWIVVLAGEPMSISALASLLALTEQQVSTTLQPLLSVIHVSDSHGLVSILHASFSDYMLDHSRSLDLYCGEFQYSEFLADRCFDVMEEQLRFNICNLESSFTLDKDVPDLEQRIETNISSSLFYACRHWGDHLHSAVGSLSLCDKLCEFLRYRLLFWMEVLNLMQCVADGISLLEKAQGWLLDANTSIDLLQQLDDARDFVTRFAAGACNHSTPHIYISALPFCVKSSSVYGHYWGRMQGLIDLQGSVTSRRERTAQATWMTAHQKILSVGFSTDGTRVVSGGSRGTISVRDARTGNIVTEPFRGDTDSVYSVAFSPDGTHIVSGSSSGAIQLWDAHTGIAGTGSFQGHTFSVASVVFSSSGTRIASGSHDKTILLWDAHTGKIVAGPFLGHTDWVLSVVFSPDDTRIVSGSSDRTIRLWNIQTGNIIAEPFQGHTGSVTSVAFSPDGTRIASGSSDQTIRLWDAHTGNAVAEPFRGHTRWVSSVSFSPNGARIVSGSLDQTVRLWDAHTGNVIAESFQGYLGPILSVAFSPDGTRVVSGSDYGLTRLSDVRNTVFEPFHGHTDWVTSVAFSPDGTRIVSGSSDQTIRLWDVHTGNIIARPFLGHTDSVLSVKFSPGGTRLASGSSDCTIRLWGTQTGDPIAEPFQGHTSAVTSVAFSPDGTRIVSGSVDRTIRLWDAHTGDVVAEPFQGNSSSGLSVTFSHDGTRIFSGSNYGDIRIWDAHTGNIIANLSQQHPSRGLLAFSPDGARVVTGPVSGPVELWDIVHDGHVVAEPFQGQSGWVLSAAFSCDGTRIVFGSDHRTIKVWDSNTRKVVAGPFQGHTDWVNSVAFSPDGTRVVSGSYDGAIRVWDLDSDAGDYQPHEDGWFKNENGLLFWVSYDFHTHVPHPCNSFVIGPQGTAFIDYRHLLLGERWSECYVS